MEDSQKRHVKLADAAKDSGVPISTLRRWCKLGLVPSFKRGPKLWYVDLDSLACRIC